MKSFLQQLLVIIASFLGVSGLVFGLGVDEYKASKPNEPESAEVIGSEEGNEESKEESKEEGSETEEKVEENTEAINPSEEIEEPTEPTEPTEPSTNEESVDSTPEQDPVE